MWLRAPRSRLIANHVNRVRAKRSGLDSEGIDHLQLGKTMKIRVPGANRAYAMLAHEHNRVRIMEQISREPRVLADDLLGDIPVPRCR